MYSFKNDYATGAHPNILKKLIETNLEEQPGYGEDGYCKAAKDCIRSLIEQEHAAIYFLSGGTQSNLIVIASLLRVHEAVISAKTGHIFSNETGAIESLGHKVIAVDTPEGKLSASDVEAVLAEHTLRPHVVKPKLVYISNSSETGTIYHKQELEALARVCKEHQLYLFMDGARLGHALTATGNDLDLPTIARLCDVFYIGGTKNGALLGEAVVFKDPGLCPDFDYVLKQKGALLAKGRLLGIQFLELFREGLYFELARHANTMAQKIADACRALGKSFYINAPSNQIFPIFSYSEIERLSQKYDFYVWVKIDADHAAIRLITSWSSDEKIVDQFIADIRAL